MRLDFRVFLQPKGSAPMSSSTRQAEAASFEFDAGVRDVRAERPRKMRLAEDVEREEEHSAEQQCGNHDPEYAAKPLPAMQDPLPPVVAVQRLDRLGQRIWHVELLRQSSASGNDKPDRPTAERARLRCRHQDTLHAGAQSIALPYWCSRTPGRAMLCGGASATCV